MALMRLRVIYQNCKREMVRELKFVYLLVLFWTILRKAYQGVVPDADVYARGEERVILSHAPVSNALDV